MCPCDRHFASLPCLVLWLNPAALVINIRKSPASILVLDLRVILLSSFLVIEPLELILGLVLSCLVRSQWFLTGTFTSALRQYAFSFTTFIRASSLQPQQFPVYFLVQSAFLLFY